MAQVTTKEGVLLGKKSKTENNFEYYEFLQIPYAKPPLGNLRFQVPQPPEPWEGVRDATTTDEMHVSYQEHKLGTNYTKRGSEDCLYLNVFKPHSAHSDSKLLPVMVYIHGGGFTTGTGIIKAECGPEFLIKQDVVVVSINYRVGVFGFLSLDIPEAAGNMGLKDQVMALQWIQNNISEFGGDRNNVTVFGISAGSASVEYLILSPLSKGLFHKAILQSGSALNQWALYTNAKDLSVKLAIELGYKGSHNDSHSIYNFLLEQPTDTIGQTFNHKVLNIAATKTIAFGIGPSVEKDFGNGHEFLTDYPYNILKEARFNKVVTIRGYCEFEGLFPLGMKPQLVQELREKKNYTDFWSNPLGIHEQIEYNAKFEQIYENEEDDEQGVIDFFGDHYFAGGICIASKIMAGAGVPVYAYSFGYEGNYNIVSKKIFNIPKRGACHGDDMGYIFNVSYVGPIKASDQDVVTRNRMVMMWTNFAKYGNPTPTTNQLLPLQWPRYTNDKLEYLKIDKELQVLSNYRPDGIARYEEIYEKHLYL